MKIKTFEEWAKDNPVSSPEDAYNAAVELAKVAHEEEAVSIMEYFESKMRRTSDLDLATVTKLVEIADLIPNIGERIEPETVVEITNGLKLLKEMVAKDEEPDFKGHEGSLED